MYVGLIIFILIIFNIVTIVLFLSFSKILIFEGH